MRVRASFGWGFLLPLFFSSCGPTEVKEPVNHGVVAANQYASYFKIEKRADHTLLTTYLNFERSDSAVYVIYNAGRPAVDSKVLCVKAPVQRVACLTSVFIGFLQRFGATGTIGAVDDLDFVSDSTVLRAAQSGKIKELASNGRLNMEPTLTSDLQVLFTNPSGDKKLDLDERLLAAQIVPVVCADYFERHPLARAEWIKVFALFLGKEEEGERLFAETRDGYMDLKRMADTCRYRPTVFSEIKTSDAWFVAGGQSSLAQFFADAGAEYLWKDNGKVSVTAMSMEQVVEKALNAEYWLHLHLCNTAEEVAQLDARYTEFKAYKKRNLYNNNALLNSKGGNAYWETGLCNPDEVLSDLLHIFHPNLQPGKKLKYYKRLE